MKRSTRYFVFIIFIFSIRNVFIEVSGEIKSPPNIILIVADDLGWNDVGFHGSSQIPTPNIDILAYSGIILNNYYVNPLCTPSRSSLLTGKYPIHTGMQHGIITPMEPRGLPLTEKLLPEYLRELGYKNHMVGKWHLGNYKKVYTPTYRGFDSHLGLWTGHHDYFDHSNKHVRTWGLDMRRNMELAKDLHGQYSTDIFTEEAVKLIHNHNNTKPFFLYLAHTATHSGNQYNPLPAPDEYVAKFSYIKEYKRQRFAGILSKLDESVGDVMNALHEKKMLDNSIVIFTTDNGGHPDHPKVGKFPWIVSNSASNYPLRGVKGSLWEGGIRGSALVWSSLFKTNSSQRVSNDLMHITDWLPTLLESAGGYIKDFGNATKSLDGLSQWKTLTEGKASPRGEILHNIDEIYGVAAGMKGPWKIVKGETLEGKLSKWFGPSGRDYTYNFTALEASETYKILKSMNKLPDKNKMEDLRKSATISCTSNTTSYTNCDAKEKACLFNIQLDPCEKYNLVETFPNILEEMKHLLERYNKTSVPPGNKPPDPRADPKYWNYAWVNFGDYI